MSPKANQNLRWLSISVLLAVGVVFAVLGTILVVVAICLIIGAQKVSDAFTLLLPL